MSDERRILRWEVPIDDQDHPTNAAGPILRAAGHREFWSVVEFWSMEGDPDFQVASRVVRVFGTGQPIPDGYEWLATAERTAQGLVWHLFERTGGDR